MPDTPPPPPPPPLPVPPELFTFPIQLLEQWVAIPSDERIKSSGLTRQDIDHLVLGMLRLADAQNKLNQTLVDWSNGRLDGANAAHAEFQRLNNEAQNHIRQFFTAFMTSAVQGRANAK